MSDRLTHSDWVYLMVIKEQMEEEELVQQLEQHRNRNDPMEDIRHALREGYISGEERDGTRVYWLRDDESDEEHVIPDSIDLNAEVGDRGPEVEDFLGESDTSSDRIQSCLEEAVGYYHDQITSVQRGWIREKWGFPDEVIDDLQIGWADDTNGLIDHLREKGYSDVEIARAGLATSNALKHVYRCHEDDCTHYHAPDVLTQLRDARIEDGIEVDEINSQVVIEYAVDEGWHNLYDWWDKRVVFPYPDESGDHRYLIARRTHASDDVPGKYLKLQVRSHTDNEAVYEPIYGLHEYTRSDDLVLTEGITDAIWAHYRGINCLAPVTKQFKQEHIPRLIELAQDADRVIICNDAEETSNGLEAALRTADELAEEGIDVFVAELPRKEDEEKLDLADYLRDHDENDFRENVLSDAVKPEEHPMYDEVFSEENVEIECGCDSLSEDDDEPDTDGERNSALFELTIEDVIRQDTENSVRRGYRGDNPIEHVGNSHSNYFVYERYKGQELRARDFKAEHTYTPLTWLACASGARSTDSPGGSLTGSEMYECWKYAKDEGMIPEDDPVPYRVLTWLAVREGLIDRERADEDGLTAADYNAALTMVERDGYDPGRDRVESSRAERAADAAINERESEDDTARAINSLVNDMLKKE